MIIRGFRCLCLIIIGAVALTIPGFLIWTSAGYWTSIGWSGLWESQWYPYEGIYGMLTAVVGTALTVTTGLVIAVPTGLAAAIFCAEIVAPPVRLFIRIGMELMAAVPSVVYGLLGLWLVVPLLARIFDRLTGHSLLAASIILALMILPTVMTLSEDAIASVRGEQRQAALALGLDWPALLWKVLLPQAWPGIRSGILQALGRALGETIAVMLVVGSLDRLPIPWWDLLQPGQTLASRIGREIGEATLGSLHFSALMGCALLLAVAGALITLCLPRRGRVQ